jgi:hypothetical protein
MKAMHRIKPILISLAVLAGVAAIGYHIYLRIVDSIPPPAFSFDASNATGWWGSDNINVQDVAGNNYQGEEPKDKLPVADLTVHHGRPGETTPEDSCFTLFSYYDYPLEGIDAAHQDYIDRKEELGTLEQTNSLRQTIETFEGQKSYDLKQYDYEVEGQDVLSGYQIGFITMSDGHIRTEGVCKTVKDLELVQPVLQTVRLNER